jgi:hypothetical protein
MRWILVVTGIVVGTIAAVMIVCCILTTANKKPKPAPSGWGMPETFGKGAW